MRRITAPRDFGYATAAFNIKTKKNLFKLSKRDFFWKSWILKSGKFSLFWKVSRKKFDDDEFFFWCQSFGEKNVFFEDFWEIFFGLLPIGLLFKFNFLAYLVAASFMVHALSYSAIVRLFGYFQVPVVPQWLSSRLMSHCLFFQVTGEWKATYRECSARSAESVTDVFKVRTWQINSSTAFIL